MKIFRVEEWGSNIRHDPLRFLLLLLSYVAGIYLSRSHAFIHFIGLYVLFVGLLRVERVCG